MLNIKLAAVALIVILLAAALAVSCNEPAEEQPAEAYHSSQVVETPAQQSDQPADAAENEPADGEGAAPDAGADENAADEAGEDQEAAGDTAMPGADVYVSANCGTCHREDRGGGKMAPALIGLSGNWDTTTLEQYLTDPEAYTANDPRLNAMSSQYTLKMPAWQGSAADMAALIDWLLAN